MPRYSYIALATLLLVSGSSDLYAQRITAPGAGDSATLLSISCSAGSRGRTVAVQLGGGLAAGSLSVLGANGVLMLIESLVAVATGDPDMDFSGVANLAMFPAYVVGSAVAIYWIGRGRGYRGRFLPTLGGSVLGLGAPGATLTYHWSDRSEGAEAC